MIKKFVGVEEVATVLDVEKSWIYSRTRKKGKGQIPHYRLGKYVKFDLDEVVTWLKTEQQAA